jgi:flagellar hook-associated protein 1 FlgK
MAGNITLALRTAQSGLLTSQSALDSVANNIANVNTPGYSRKIVNTEQRVVDGSGAGTQLSAITRNIDEGLLKSLRDALTDFNQTDVSVPYYERIQELFGKPGDNTSIAHTVESLTQSIESLAVSPDRTLEQKEMVRWANETALQMQTMSQTVQDLRLQADRDINTSADRVEVLLGEIEDLNNKIIRNETVARDVTDLKDKRDNALTELSGLLDIVYFTRNQGDVVVFTRGGSALVDSAANTFSHTAATALTAITTYQEGHIEGLYAGNEVAANDISLKLQGGKLKGLVDLRDNVLPDLQAQIDELASKLRDYINEIHNRGAPFPGHTSVEGTRTFVDPANQTITLGGTEDVRVVLFDGNGDQVAAGSLRNDILGGATTTINNLATQLQTWIQANGGSGSAAVTVNADGKLQIDLNTSDLYLTFRDETATASGSTASDVTINFDADADGTVDRQVSGFSNFFGLNDFFVTDLEPTRFDSAVKQSSFTWLPTGAVTLNFLDSTGATDSVTFAGGTRYTLQDIADAINDTATGISFATATVIPDGSGYRLRITHDDSLAMAVVDDQGVGATDSLTEALGLEVSDARAARFIHVRSDIVAEPSSVARGIAQWDSAIGAAGEYYMSAGDNTVAQAMAEMMTSRSSFESAGGQPTFQATFADYAGAIVADAASEAETNNTRWESQKALTDSLQLKSDNVKGVNLDEEMSNLVLYQQAYSASARVVAVIREMFDALDRAVQ